MGSRVQLVLGCLPAFQSNTFNGRLTCHASLVVVCVCVASHQGLDEGLQV